jgi:hypothetical protein
MKTSISTIPKPLGRLFGEKRRMILAAGLMVGAAGFILWKLAADRPQPWLARARVQRYLEKNTYVRDFKVEFAFPSRAELAKAPASSAAGSPKSLQESRDFEKWRNEYLSLKMSVLTLAQQVELSEAELKALSMQLAPPGATNAGVPPAHAVKLRERMADLQRKTAAVRLELQAREQALAPVASELQAIQQRWLAEAEADGSASARRAVRAASQFTAELGPEYARAVSYEKMYRLIGQEIWVASRLVASANPGLQRVGVTLALDASRHALEDAQNGWVAARICEGYVWPHLRLATDSDQDSAFNPDNLLAECANIFRRNLEVRNVVRICGKTLARAGTAQRADWARSQVAMACEEAGDLKGALGWWRQIQNTNDYRWVMRRLPGLQQQVARK